MTPEEARALLSSPTLVRIDLCEVTGPAAGSEILDLCDRWDRLSKGETETTRAVRAAYEADRARQAACVHLDRVLVTSLAGIVYHELCRDCGAAFKVASPV